MAETKPCPTKITVPCEAGDHLLHMVTEIDEHLIYVSFYIGSFYARQSSWLGRMLERARIVGMILLGREYQFEDIVLGTAQAPKLAEFFAQAAVDCEAKEASG